jgi:YfiH family protein
MTRSEKSRPDVGEELARAYPELEAVRATAEAPVYLVGGAVRDLLLGRGRADVDLAVEGDAAALAAKLGAEPAEHERFGTAKVRLDGHEVDVAGTRSETYPRPGALPVVSPAESIRDDLGRRDFTINAMARPLREPAKLIDPHGGEADLGAGLLRVLHPRSFLDDPTRALRAARYAARFEFALEPETENLLRATDLGTVSADRRRAELLRLAAEATAARGFELLAEWGLVELREGGVELARRVGELLAKPPWEGFAPRDEAVLAAALGPVGAEAELATSKPASPSRGVELAGKGDPVELVLARALGAEWLDGYLEEWRFVGLEIDGGDLLAAGVPEGPVLGRALAAALAAKLDGEASGREQELAAALATSTAASFPSMDWCENDGARWLEADLGGARVAFTTRVGGVSEAPFDSLNLGLLTEDAPAAVAANRARLAAALGLAPDRIAFARQVHGAELEFHAGPGPDRGFVPDETENSDRGRGETPDADGQIVTVPGIAGLVFVADCLPVALYGPGGVAMLHCGWRGLAAGIVARGAEAVAATVAAIGPGIGGCCYEVGEEVLGAFADLGDGIADGRMLDLPEVARRLLADAGVDRVQSVGLCTSCEPELFFSHRRDRGRTGRQAGVAWLDPGEG